MQSALLAALALCQLPVFLYPQDALDNVSWPTHAVITVPQGSVPPDHQLYLLEDGQPMLAQVEVAARWPDGSPKWLHGFGSFRYRDGQAARYAFVHQGQPPAGLPDSPLVVRDTPEGIHVDTGVIELQVDRPFAGISLIAHRGQQIVSGVGGPSVVDGDGTVWHSVHDREAEITLERNGPAQVTIKAVGWYQTPENREDAFCRFTTRITATANSAIIKIDHATTFADDMKKHAVAELGFKFALVGAGSFASSTARGNFGERLHAAYLAQLADDRLWRIAQTGPDEARDLQSKGDYERSAGWFAADFAEHRLALLTKDFWQKCPKEVKISPDELVFYAWPRHGELCGDDPDATQLEKVYKFQCFHRGDQLTSILPDAYYEALDNQPDTTECKALYAQSGNLQGVSMRNQFALAVLPTADAATSDDAYVEKLVRLFGQNPVVRVSPAALASSGVFGPVATAGDDFADVEQTTVDAMLGYANSIARWGDYGWGIYGNTHHNEWMNPNVAGVAGGRPSLHRVWNNNHYQYVSTAWQMWATNGDRRLLDWARTCTDNYASVGQIRYDKQWYQQAGQKPRRPSVRRHFPGGFFHCKALLPWGSRPYGIEATDSDAALFGHWPDPSALLFAWLLDADGWAKDGFELWLEEVKLPDRGRGREANQTLVQAINAYEYRPTPELLEVIRSLGTVSRGAPILTQKAGPLWEPTWLSRYHELVPEDEEFSKFLVTSADEVGQSIGGIWSLALSATAYDITGDSKYLLQHAGTIDRAGRLLFQDPSGRWQNYGLAPSPGRDCHLLKQWPRFLAALRKAGITRLDPPDDPGQYLCSSTRSNNARDVRARGTRIFVLQSDAPGEARDELTLEAASISSGDLHAISLELLAPSGEVAWNEPRIKMSEGQAPRVDRPNGLKARRESFPLPAAPGAYQLLVGTNEAGIYQGLAGGLPECQALQNTRISAWDEPVRYICQLSRGYLVPRVQAPVTLRFSATGDCDGSYVAITPAEGPRGQRWLRAGESVDIDLSRFAAPWLLEIYGGGFSRTEVEVLAAVEEPLLYGSKLEDVQRIQQILGR